MDEKLLKFIEKHIEIDSDIDKVKQTLLNVGHGLNVVEEHIAHALKNKKLRGFIKNQLEMKVDSNRIKQYLLDKGYDIKSVEQHIYDVIRGITKSKRKKYGMIVKGLFIILIIFTALFIFRNYFVKKNDPIQEDIRNLQQQQSNASVQTEIPATQLGQSNINSSVCACNINPKVCDTPMCTCDSLCLAQPIPQAAANTNTSQSPTTSTSPTTQPSTPPPGSTPAMCTCDVIPNACDTPTCICDSFCSSQTATQPNATSTPPPNQPPPAPSSSPPTMCTCDLSPALCDTGCICDTLCP